MASPGFYNENANRAYPFVADRTSSLPPGLIVDAGFVMGILSRFGAADSVRLARVTRAGSAFTVEFESTAPELYGVPLAFTLTLATPRYAAKFNDTGESGFSESSHGSETDECRAPLWSGFMVPGDPAAYAALLPTNGTVTFSDVVEPALVQNLAAAYVSKLGLANDDRARASPPDGCGDTVEPASNPYVANHCTVGAVVFKPGYNATVRYNASENAIVFGAGVGAGAGEPCGEVPLYAGDPLGGALHCGDVVRTLNGRGGPDVRVSGTGVTITPVPEDNTLIVDVDMRGLATAFPVSHRSESC